MKLRAFIGWAFWLGAITTFSYVVCWLLDLGSANAPGDGGPNFIPLFILLGCLVGGLICALTGLHFLSSLRGRATKPIDSDVPDWFNRHKDTIAEIAIDNEGRLRIVPSTNIYPKIHREAVEVNWDEAERFLYSPKPRDWSYLDWFKHIINTAGDLSLTPDTKWTNVPEELRRQAEAWMGQRARGSSLEQPRRRVRGIPL